MSTGPNVIRRDMARPEVARVGDSERVRVFDAYNFASLDDDPELTALVGFAARLCEAPIALVSLLAGDSFHFLARIGTDETENPYSTSFCSHVILGDELLVVPDATRDPRFAENPLVTGEPGVRFYAGFPLVSEEQLKLGALCVVDTHARPGGLTELQRDGLAVVAQSVMRRMRSRRNAVAARREMEKREGDLRLLADSIPAIAWSAAPDGRFEFVNRRFEDFTGVPGYGGGTAFHPDDWKKAGKQWRRSLQTGKPYEVEHRLRRHDGEYRWMISRAVAQFDSQGAIVRWFGTAVDIHDLYAASEARELLARELSHRIKNIFAVVAGLIALTARKAPEHRGFADELTATIRALGRAHDYVRPAGDTVSATLHGLLADLFAPYSHSGEPRVRVSGDDLAVASRAATPLALVFHELATNSAKYGALSDDHGTIDLAIHDMGEKVALAWRERGGPPVKPGAEPGFGSRLVEMSVTGQLGGRWTRRFERQGLVCELEFAREAISA